MTSEFLLFISLRLGFFSLRGVVSKTSTKPTKLTQKYQHTYDFIASVYPNLPSIRPSPISEIWSKIHPRTRRSSERFCHIDGTIKISNHRNPCQSTVADKVVLISVLAGSRNWSKCFFSHGKKFVSDVSLMPKVGVSHLPLLYRLPDRLALEFEVLTSRNPWESVLVKIRDSMSFWLRKWGWVAWPPGSGLILIHTHLRIPHSRKPLETSF